MEKWVRSKAHVFGYMSQQLSCRSILIVICELPIKVVTLLFTRFVVINAPCHGWEGHYCVVTCCIGYGKVHHSLAVYNFWNLFVLNALT